VIGVEREDDGMDFRNVSDVVEFLGPSGELATVEREIDPVFEIAALIRKSSDTGGPAFRLPSVKGHPGWTVVGGVFNMKVKVRSS
jgi:UbiD family decarboxylase